VVLLSPLFLLPGFWALYRRGSVLGEALYIFLCEPC